MARVSTAPMGVRQRPEPRHCLALTRGLCKPFTRAPPVDFFLRPAAPFRLVTNGPAAESSCCGNVSASVAILIVNRLACRARRVRRARLRATWRGYQRLAAHAPLHDAGVDRGPRLPGRANWRR